MTWVCTFVSALMTMWLWWLMFLPSVAHSFTMLILYVFLYGQLPQNFPKAGSFLVEMSSIFYFCFMNKKIKIVQYNTFMVSRHILFFLPLWLHQNHCKCIAIVAIVAIIAIVFPLCQRSSCWPPTSCATWAQALSAVERRLVLYSQCKEY